MPYFVAPETDQLTLPSNSEYWVKIKRKAEYLDGEMATSSMIKFSQANVPSNGHKPTAEEVANSVLSEAEISGYNCTLIARMVVEWNLTDEKGAVVPINPISVGHMAPEDGEFLAEEASKRRGGRTEQEQRNFQKQSGRRSTATK